MKTKICWKCHKEKIVNDFAKDKTRKDGRQPTCKECINNYGKIWRQKNKEKIRKRMKIYSYKNRERIRENSKKHYEANKEYYRTKKIRNLKLKPWRKHFESTNQRCNNPNAKSYKVYGGRGIKNLMSSEEFKKLWFRDKAYSMEYPSIDRKDNNGNYTLKNCQFIEFSENVRKAQRRRNNGNK